MQHLSQCPALIPTTSSLPTRSYQSKCKPSQKQALSCKSLTKNPMQLTATYYHLVKSLITDKHLLQTFIVSFLMKRDQA